MGLTTGTWATATYGFDAAKLGVRTSEVFSGDLTNNWSASSGSPDGFGRVLRENVNQGSVAMLANGCAVGAAEVHGTIDGSLLTTVAYNPLSTDGRWSANLNLSPASHTLNVSASSRLGTYTNSASTSFTVAGTDNITNTYDPAGLVTNRSMLSGVQALNQQAREEGAPA